MKNMHPSGDYWNPFAETLPRKKIEQLQIRNFKKILAYAKDHSAFYQARYRDIDPDVIRDIKDIRMLPIIEKEDLREAQQNQVAFPFGEMTGVSFEEISTFRQTSGTTGTPVYVPESYESWQWRVEIWCHLLWMAGFRETDRVFIPFGYNVYVAFWEGHFAAEKLGCMVVPGGALDSKGRINKIMEIKATAMLNTPTYGIHMGETAKQMGINPRQTGIQRMLCAGEPLPPATRKVLEEMWDAEVYDHIGGTEPCAWGAMCAQRQGLHLMEPYFLVEILDLEEQTREVEPGELGVAVVTPLGRRSFPMIRFNTKDIVKKGRDGCDCGRTSMMIDQVVGRQDDLTKIRGVLFTPISVEELLRGEFPEIGEYQVIAAKKGIMDEIELKFETIESADNPTLKALHHRLLERLKIKTNLRFRLEAVGPGELPRYTLKAKRFRDLRSNQEVT
jgi:phenylacetate-CoA ligase